MDIAFFCSHCGQSLSIDESGAGITVDCPKCNKPVYVPSKPVSAPATPPDPPSRVQPEKTLRQPGRPSANLKQPPVAETLPGHDLALSAGETVVLQRRMHSAVVVLPAIACASICTLFAVLSAVLQHLVQSIARPLIGGAPNNGVLTSIFLAPCIPFVFLALIATVLAWLARRHTLVTLTNRRLMFNQGILSKTTVELLLKQIETVAIRLPLLGRIFGYGTVVVRGTGGGIFRLTFMQEPRQLYASLQNSIEVSK